MVAFLALLAIAYGSDSARFYDSVALQGFGDLRRPLVERLSVRIAGLADPKPVLLIAGALIATALARRRPRHALGVAVLIAGANLTTEILKPLLAVSRPPDPGVPTNVGVNAFPSGHATAAMSLAIAAILVTPARLRPLAALLGGLFPLSVSYSLLSLGVHFPSDVLGGYLVAAGWAFLVIAALLAAAERWPERTGRHAAKRALDRRFAAGAVTGMILAAAVAVAFGLEELLPRLDRVAGYAERHTAAVLVGAAIAAAAAAVLASVTLSARRR